MTIVAIVFVASTLAYYSLRAAYILYTQPRKASSPASFASSLASSLTQCFFSPSPPSPPPSSSSSASPSSDDHAPPTLYPHLDPVWGLDLSLAMWSDFARGQLAEGMRRRHARCGATFVAREALGRRCVYTIDPDNIRAVTTAQFARFDKSAWVEEASKHIGHGVLMNQGERWRRSRALLKPIFARSALDELALVEPHLQKMAAVIRARRGETFDFLELARRFSLDVVTEFLFDGSVDSLAVGAEEEITEGREFLSLVKAFDPACGLFIAVGALAWFKLAFSLSRLLAVVSGMKAFFKQRLDLLREKQECPQSRRNSGTSLFRMLEQAGLSVDGMQAELQNVFFASFDTTTALLANLVHVLAQRPDIQQKLRAEMAHLEGKPPTKQDIAAMPYLRCVLYESLRLCTPVASHSRQAAVDTTLPRGGGLDGQSPLVVRAGTSVVWSIYALNRSPLYYGDDWAVFRPERWQGRMRAWSSLPPHFMPFGSGPRSCIGQQMAQTEISYVLVRLMQMFGSMESRDERPFREAEAVSFYSAHGTLVAMH